MNTRAKIRCFLEVGLVWCFGSSDDETQVTLSLALTIRPRLVHEKEGRELVLLWIIFWIMF